jgi:hypothetical protein
LRGRGGDLQLGDRGSGARVELHHRRAVVRDLVTAAPPCARPRRCRHACAELPRRRATFIIAAPSRDLVTAGTSTRSPPVTADGPSNRGAESGAAGDRSLSPRPAQPATTARRGPAASRAAVGQAGSRARTGRRRCRRWRGVRSGEALELGRAAAGSPPDPGRARLTSTRSVRASPPHVRARRSRDHPRCSGSSRTGDALSARAAAHRIVGKETERGC